MLRQLMKKIEDNEGYLCISSTQEAWCGAHLVTFLFIQEGGENERSQLIQGPPM